MEQIICLDLDSGVLIYCCEEQPNNNSNGTVTAHLGKEWGSIAESLQGEARKEMRETDEVFIAYDTDIMDGPSSLLYPQGIGMRDWTSKSAANDAKSFKVSTQLFVLKLSALFPTLLSPLYVNEERPGTTKLS